MFKVNEYFDGRVASIGFRGEDLPATVGVMAPGDYEFSTSQTETMTVISGSMIVMLPGSVDWDTFTAGDSFGIAAGETFQLQIAADVAYLCTYE